MAGSYHTLSDAMTMRLFAEHIEPHLSVRPRGVQTVIFFDLAQRAFLFEIAAQEQELVATYVRLCEALYASPTHRQTFIDVLTEVLTDVEFDATSRMNQVGTSLVGVKDARSLLTHYTAMVENFIRPFLTPLYYYVVALEGAKSGATTPADMVGVGVGEKVKQVRASAAATSGREPSLLLPGINLDLRNGGTAHESYRDLDGGGIEVTNRHTLTGKVVRQFTVSLKDLNEALDALQRTHWAFKTGFYVFLTNSGVTLGTRKPRTRAAVEAFFNSYARNRELDVRAPFTWDRVTKTIQIEAFLLEKELPNPGGALFYGPAEAYDIVNEVTEIPLSDAVSDAMYYLSMLVDTSEFNSVSVVIKRDADTLHTATYSLANALKMIEAEPRVHLMPREGSPLSESATIRRVTEITVPAGTREEALAMLRSRRPGSTFI